MAVSQQTPLQAYTASGSSAVFAFSFQLLAAADMTVLVDGVVKTLGADFTTTTGLGGTVTMVATPTAGQRVVLLRNSTVTRSTDYQNNGDLLAAVVNADFDRLWLVLQELVFGSKASPTSVRAPAGEVLNELPVAASRASRVLAFDSSGNPISIPGVDSGSAAALAIDLASTSASKGAALIGWLRAMTGAVATTLYRWMGWREVSVFEFMTTAQVADVQGYTFALDVTAPVQAAMTAAQAAGRKLHAPAGGYLVTGLMIPGVNTTQGKANRFCMYGDSFGEAGVIALQNRGTVFKSVTNAPIFDYQASVAGEGCGDIEISHMALWGDSSTPVINIETLFGNSSLHHLTLVQSGTGDGIKIGWGATYEIYSSYITGASYAVASGLGAARTGVGVSLAQDTRSGGLQTVRKTTVAGWHTCVKVGSGAASGAYTYAPMIDTCEMAFYYRGVHFTEDCESGTVSQCYFEGQDTGIGVLDEGNYNRVRDSLFFFNGTGNTFIDSLKPGKFGGRYTGNVFYLFNGATSTGIDIRSNGVAGGPAKVAEDNHFVLSGGTAGVVGIKLQGVDPRVHLAGNDFQPAGAWTGVGTFKISDSSTSSDTTAGSGRYGFGFAQSLDGSVTVPSVGRGSVNLEVEPLVRNNTHISAGVLTLGELSAFTLTPTSNVAITGFAAPNLPGKTFSIHVTATAFTVTFTHGALLKLTTSGNIATGANGAWLTFQIKAGGVAWLTSHIAY